MEGITKKASGKDYLMQHLGTYITRICDAASTHHVMLNQAFISAALAVKVQEGIALAMDPAVEIWRVAIPIILEGERRYRTKQGKEMLGVEQILDWISGGKLSEHKAMKERQKRSAEYGLDKDPKTSTSTTAIVSN
jgi:predicted unusual protein kinase regulating ubiquinone biosynthesis (AarF/ABC1/UbiB family)